MGLSDRNRLEVGMLVYCTCCLGALAMLIISFIWAIQSRDQVELFKDSVSSFVSNWETDMVFDLTLSANPTLPSSQYYVTEWKSQWPGNNEGCWCERSNGGLRVSRGLKERKCNSNETRVGCQGIDERGPQDLKKWVNSQIVYSVRGSKTSFKANYLNIKPDGTCESGFKNCGDKNSKSRGLCIPSSFTDCPLTEVSSTSQNGYKSLSLLGLTLYLGTPSDKNPICDLMYVQDHACFIRSHYARAPGRSKYDILKGDHDSCIKDPSVTYLSSMGEVDLLDINGVDYGRLYNYGASNDYQYRMSSGRFVQWSPDCSDTVESLNQKSQEVVDIYGQHKVLFGLYIASLSIAGLVFLSNCFTFFEISKQTEGARKILKYTFLARVAGWILVFPSIVICFAKVTQLYNYFNNIANLGCSDDQTNVILKQVAENVKSQIIKKENVTLALSVVGFVIEAFNCYLYLKLFKLSKELAGLSSPSDLKTESFFRRYLTRTSTLRENKTDRFQGTQPIAVPFSPVQTNEVALAHPATDPESQTIQIAKPADSLPPINKNNSPAPLPPGFLDNNQQPPVFVGTEPAQL